VGCWLQLLRHQPTVYITMICICQLFLAVSCAAAQTSRGL
jgi:hypothetical protein